MMLRTQLCHSKTRFESLFRRDTNAQNGNKSTQVHRYAIRLICDVIALKIFLRRDDRCAQFYATNAPFLFLLKKCTFSARQFSRSLQFCALRYGVVFTILADIAQH